LTAAWQQQHRWAQTNMMAAHGAAARQDNNDERGY